MTATYNDAKPLILTIEDAIEKKNFFDINVPSVKLGKFSASFSRLSTKKRLHRNYRGHLHMFVLSHCSGKDIAVALKECDTVIKGEVVVGSQHHFYMETLSAAATPTVSYTSAAMARLRI